MNERPVPEPWEAFLQRPPRLPAPDGDMREALFKQTAGLLPRKRRWRRAAMLTALAACVALALGGAYLALRPEAIKPHIDLVEHETAPPIDVPSAKVLVQDDPLKLEWKAFDATDDLQKVQLYFRAGDLYLERDEDLESALRCYHQALLFCGAREREFNADDNWLVMALKHELRKDN